MDEPRQEGPQMNPTEIEETIRDAAERDDVPEVLTAKGATL